MGRKKKNKVDPEWVEFEKRANVYRRSNLHRVAKRHWSGPGKLPKSAYEELKREMLAQ